jgi:hypothetical protein
VAQDPRGENLLALCRDPRYVGKMDVARLKEVMDLGLAEGGAKHDGTVCHVLAAPAKKTVRLQAPGFSGRAGVDASGLFRSE